MKRGDSGLSLIVGIDKPIGMSSHDAVNRCRHIFDEKRIGHAGTLDPLASGALLLCVGPATRLNCYFTEQDKRYRFMVVFGSATETDDCAGRVIRTAPIPESLYETAYAESFVQSLIGRHKQVPPAYSAVKVQGKRSYKAAREGVLLDLEARDIEVYDAKLIGIEDPPCQNALGWEIEAEVSKGSYIRALARDIGNQVGCPAHIGSLRRTRTGRLSLDDCIALDDLEEAGVDAALDPVALLGYRIAFVQGKDEAAVANGAVLDAEGRKLFICSRSGSDPMACTCTPGIMESTEALARHEVVAVVAQNKLVGLYRYERDAHVLKPQCVFPVGVTRGNDSKSR